MNLILFVTFFLMGIKTGWGHSIARVEETQKEVNSTPSQEVYEVTDDTSSLKLVYPKQDLPTLMEIVYYHVIEKLYGKSDAPGFDDTVRRFTNSHGYQYFDQELNKGLIEEIPESADIPEENYIEEELIKVPDNKTATTENPELDLEIIYIDEMEDGDNTAVSEIPADIVKDDVEELKTDEQTQTRTDPELTRHTEEEVLTEKALEVKAKRTRNLLFDRVKEKYHNKNNEKNNTSPVAHRRRKRGVTGRIPEAPRLKDLDLESLPPHIRNMISVGENYFKNHEKKKEIEHKMRGLFDKLDNDESGNGSETADGDKAADGETSDDDDETADGDETGDGDETADGPSPKTYGMILDGDSGFVWNDMWPETGVSYEILPPNEKPEQKPRAKKQKFNEELGETKDFEENMEDGGKNETKEEEAKEEESENDKDYSEEETLNEEISQSEHVQDENKNGMPEGALRKQKKRKEKDDPMKDLIENEQFWKWLEDWTSVYMEELTKHIKKQIKEEVSKQMKDIANSHKDDEDKKKTQEQDTNNKQNKDESNKDKTDNIKDKPVSNNDSGKPKPNDNENKIISKDPKKNQKSEILLLENTDNNVDGEKSNEQKNEDTKSKSDEEKVINNKTSPVSLKAKNIYGSSIGSDKLTNIFIFYPSKETNNIIDDLKPANLSEPGTYVFGNLELEIKKENKAGNDKIDVKETPVINSEVESSTLLIDKRINADETTTIPADKTPSTEKPTLEKTPNSSEIENDIPTTEKPAVNTIESKLDEKEQSKNDTLKKNSETELGKEPIADKKEVSDSSEKDDTKKENDSKDKVDKKGEISEDNAVKDDSETEMPDKTTEKPDNTTEKPDKTKEKSKA